MQALKFNLSGKTAIFKRPDVNVHCYFTYSHIHKPALLGILGAICGFSGYNQQKTHNDKQIKEKQSDILEFPEFYEELKDIKISVIPKEPTFSVKKQKFNNSVGYASQEEGGNLIVTEQWLENPAWEIFILLDESKAAEDLKQRFLNREFVFIPYLGKNDHFANITNIEIVDLEKVQNCSKIVSMVFANKIDKTEQDNNAWEDETNYFKYTERLPIALDGADNQYILEKFVFTNYKVILNSFEDIYSCKDINIAFF